MTTSDRHASFLNDCSPVIWDRSSAFLPFAVFWVRFDELTMFYRVSRILAMDLGARFPTSTSLTF